MGRPIYVDLDDTLITSVTDGDGDVIEIVPRPGVNSFLGKLSRHGNLFLLTHAMTPHVDDAFRALGSVTRMFTGVISRETMEPVIEQVDYLLENPDLTADQKLALYNEIVPIVPRGVVFDDQPVGSQLYLYKAASVGASPEDWIQVPPFKLTTRRDRHLEGAYREYRMRAGGKHAALSARRVTASA